MLSVIIPTWNRDAFIGRALDSVLGQTHACAEVIVVDDGSNDTTAQIVGEISNRSRIDIKYVYQENKGASAARNTGITEARHDMLCFLDSDDWWHKRKLEKQHAAMVQEPQYLISHTREIWYRGGKQVNQKKKHAPPHGEIFSRALQMCVVGMSTVMCRRQLFEQYGMFDEALLCCEDYDLWLRVSCGEEFLLVDDPLTLKDGGRGDQLSALHRQGMDTWRIRSLCRLLDSGVLRTDQYQLALAELRRKCTIYGNGCMKHGRPEEGKKYLTLPENYTHQTPYP